MDKSKKSKMNLLMEDAHEVARTGGWEVDLTTNEILWTKMVNIIHEVPLDYTPKSYEECFEHFKEGEFRDRIYALASKAITDGMPWDEEVIMVTAKGNEIWIRTKGQAEFNNGVCTRIFGICQDINEFKLSQLQYRESADQLKRAITASKVGSWEYNLTNGDTIWDDICYELHGLDKVTTNLKPYRAWRSTIHPDDFEPVKNELLLYYQGIGSGTIEYRVILPDNSIRYLKATVTFLSESNGKYFKGIGITQDVTKEKISERKLKEFANLTGEQNNSLTNFAHMVSHDLRSHSTNLSVLSSLLVDKKYSEEEKNQILEMLKKATESLNSTVCNLNEVVLSNDQDIEDKLTSVNLLKAITTVQNNISTLFKDKKAICVLDIPTDHTVTVVPAYLDSILLNLFTNSLKYCYPSRPPVIQISTVIKNDTLLMEFSDNGKGIDIIKHGKTIFGMNKTFHRNKDARGVGLYITKNQIEAMGGSISVVSEVNVGTKFSIIFKI